MESTATANYYYFGSTKENLRITKNDESGGTTYSGNDAATATALNAGSDGNGNIEFEADDPTGWSQIWIN